MTYTNTPVITSTTGLWSNANGISFSSINTIPNIPFNAQLEVERVFSSDRDGSTSVITNFLTDLNVKQSDKRELFLVPNSRLTINNQTKTITAINLPSTGNDVYNFVYYKTNAPNVQETIKVPTVADNSNITIRRKTVSNIPLISWVPGSKLTSSQLNLQTTQFLYLAQELLDRVFILTTTNYSLVFNLANNTVNTLQIVDGAVTPSKISTANTPWSFNGTVSVLAPTADANATTRLYSLNRLFEHGVMTKDDSAPSSSAIDILETAPTAGASGLWFNPKSGQLSAWAGNAWVAVAGTPVTTANLVSTNTVQTLTAAKTFAAGTVVPFTQTGAGAVARTVGAKLNEFISVKDFGAVGDGVANDTAAIQAAVNHAISQNVELHFPAGTYHVSSPIQWAGRLVMRGAPGWGSGAPKIVAVAAINAILQGSVNPLDYAVTRWSCISNIAFVCNGAGGSAAYGIQGATAFSTFENLYVQGATSSAIQVFSAIDSDFRGLWLSYNNNGLDLRGICNQCSIVQCKMSLNSGFGLRIQASAGILVSGCLIESNERAGIYLMSVRGFHITGCYFGNTLTTGVQFTSPAEYTAKADIVVNGGANEYTISGGYDSRGSVISGNYSESGNADFFVFGPALRWCSIHGNSFNEGIDPIPVVGFYGNPNSASRSFNFGSALNVELGPNSNFLNTIDIVQTAASAYNGGPELANNKYFGVASQNIAETDFSRWGEQYPVDGGTLARSPDEFFANPNVPVWRLTLGAGPFSSSQFGWLLDASKYERYHNKWMAFGMWQKSSLVNGLVDVTARSTSTKTATELWSTLGWKLRVAIFKMPTSGSFIFGFRAIAYAGEAAGATVDIACPVLCELGADYNALWGAYGRQVEFYGTAAPSAGTWKRGDIVWNTTPSAGGDPGFMCVVAGTPGTWKAMANLDA